MLDGNPVPINSHFPPPPHLSLSSWKPLIILLSISIVLPFWTFHVNRIMWYVTFCIWLPSFNTFVFNIPLYCMCQYFILSPNSGAFDRPHFVCLFLSWWIFGFLLFVYKFLWGHNFSSVSHVDTWEWNYWVT